MVYRIGFIGDLHGGSPYAPAPDEFYIGDEERQSCRIESNPIQKNMFKHLEEASDELGKLDLLVLMGDQCDGDDYKGRGTSAINTNLDFQVDLSVDMLSIFRPKRIVSVAGSPYHNGNNLTTDHNVCDKLCAKLKVKGTHTMDKFITAGDRLIHVRHETPYHKKPDNRVTGLINEIREFTMDGYYVPGENMPHILVRGHTHYFEEVETRGIKALINPCWKWRDEFVTKRGVYTPDLGYLTIEIDGSYYESYINTFKLPQHLDRSGSPLIL